MKINIHTHYYMKNDKMTLDALGVLVEGGYSVLEVADSAVDGQLDPLYLVTYGWNAAFTSPAASVDYNVATGVDITDWLRRNVAVAYNRSDFLARLDEYLRGAVVVRVEFWRGAPWRRWSRAV